MRIKNPCAVCYGTGKMSKTSKSACYACKGKGQRYTEDLRELAMSFSDAIGNAHPVWGYLFELIDDLEERIRKLEETETKNKEGGR